MIDEYNRGEHIYSITISYDLYEEPTASMHVQLHLFLKILRAHYRALQKLKFEDSNYVSATFSPLDLSDFLEVPANFITTVTVSVVVGYGEVLTEAGLVGLNIEATCDTKLTAVELLKQYIKRVGLDNGLL